MTKIALVALLASSALSSAALAADMAVKAPPPAAVPYTDWSGVYVGVGAGFGWGREKLDQDVGTFDNPLLGSSQLFGTSTTRIFNGTSVLIAPPFVMQDCLIDNCNKTKMNGFIAGGFAGVQKQWGNWVLGLEASFDATGMKKSFDAEEVPIQNVVRFQPTTTIGPLTGTGTLFGVAGAGGGYIANIETINGVPIATPPVITGQIIAGPVIVSIPAFAIGLPREELVRAQVTRAAHLDTKVDEIADIRGKVGLTNIFSPNIMMYATGGASIGHFTKTLSISQSVRVCGNQGAGACNPAATGRDDIFEASSGDTRLGWVVGAGLDWKLTQNLVLGALYRHHEFPKHTVAFNDGTNSLGFGTSRASVDSVQGRLSVLFPIH